MSSEKSSEYYEIENQEWLNSLDYVIENEDQDRVRELLFKLQSRAQKSGIDFSCPLNTPYINSIPLQDQVPYPGSLELERKLKSIIRWNAMAMVVRANKEHSGIGGHISTYASAATLFEVGFNHFFKGGSNGQLPDLVYFQGHASPGVYARSFVEGRLSKKNLEYFRQEVANDAGLSSYPHPRLMPDYWKFPTVSMGLSPIMAIYQARFMKYLEDRGLIEGSDQKVWAFLGDGEMDEPESLGSITVASREELENLIFVVNCNLQRLDGPVRGNSKVIQELEATFKGAGWNVIKVVWGSEWDPLIQKDKKELLLQRMNELVDGQYQRYVATGGKHFREDFFGKHPDLLKMVENYSDEQLEKMRRGGHDPEKVYNAYHAAVNHKGSPTVILAQTIKGYGLGEAGEGRNVTHQQKKLNEEELRQFRGRFGIPISDKDLEKAPFYKPADDSEEIKYLKKQREKLGGYLPVRENKAKKLPEINEKIFEEFLAGSDDREVATTMVIVQMMGKLLKDKKMGKNVVPIVPDESRTFGMDALFRQAGIYSHVGQKYEPVDKESLLYYKEAKDGAILEEGITEAGSISSFIAAGNAHVNFGVYTIPFFIFYSMFGFQRVGDLIWAAGDARAKGFMIGGTSGRTTLPGEGLQHQDGQSHLMAYSVPNCKAYDPAFAYEIAVIVREGIRRMYHEDEDIFYYITVMNEKYQMPKLPKNGEKGILKGMYRYQRSTKKIKVNLLGSGAILNETLKAAEILKNQFDIGADIWSVTSYKEIYQDAQEVDRWNRLHPDKKPKKSYINECFPEDGQTFIAASDYVKALPLSVSYWFPGDFTALGTDGFGRSDNRGPLRDFFEVNDQHIAFAAISSLFRQNKVDKKLMDKAKKELEIDFERINPVKA